uniref:Odorant-binding protein 4 n=1 Tax=Helopeltis theivora TaxID=393766 RepID=A0A6B9RWK2_9HEMI|nr:odorant-binding protein 4 [Helopeltis theivora]
MAGGKFKSSGISKVATKIYPNNAAKSTRVRHILTHCGAIASRETEKCQAAYKLADCTTTLSEKLKL